MKSFAKQAVDRLKANGADYADARVVDLHKEVIEVKGNQVENIADNAGAGIGIRVLLNGSWGFAATSKLTESEIDACADRAMDIAKASAETTHTPATLDARDVQTGKWVSPREIDPFTVPLEEKIGLLVDACNTLKSDDRIRMAKGHIKAIQEKKFYIDSEGADLFQDILHCGASVNAIAEKDDEVQVRSFPNSHDGDWAAAGYEWIKGLGLTEQAEQVREEVIALLTAPECPADTMDLILGGPQLALQIHESCGHPTELDRALGTEISLAGGSFMTPERLGNLQYGSKLVNLYGDATVPGALGTFGWDDEGVPGQRFDLVKNGLFVGYQTSRETAASMGQQSNGSMRADGWSKIPLIRMTNINLAADPNGPSLEELIADTKRGILIEINKSWSIDDLRLNFSFGGEQAFLIENGKKTTVLKNPVYTGITPKFWGSCDAICNEDSWRTYGVANCGKGQPMQIMRVAHGCSAARFKNVQVGRKK